MTKNIHEASIYTQVSQNRSLLGTTRHKPGAFRWWTPDCDETDDAEAANGCSGDEPALVNGWAQPANPLEPFAFRLHADGSLEFKGHLDSAGASSGTVAFTLPGAVAGEVDFLTGLNHDQFFVSAVYDGATAQPALVYIDMDTGDVTITFPL